MEPGDRAATSAADDGPGGAGTRGSTGSGPPRGAPPAARAGCGALPGAPAAPTRELPRRGALFSRSSRSMSRVE